MSHGARKQGSHFCRMWPAPALLSLAACEGIQSPLVPHGPGVQQIASLGWIMFAGATTIFLLVAALVAYAIFAPPRRRTWLGKQSFIIGAGVVFPLVTLSALLLHTFAVANRIVAAETPAPLRLEVTGEMWWWRVHYFDATGAPQLATANEIHIPIGRPVEISLKSADVIHSFWVPGLSGMLDMIPGRVNKLRLTADKTGVLRGQCAEYCGAQHAKMAFYVLAQTPAEFDAWLTAQTKPAQEPRTAEQMRGRTLFAAHCAACHVVRGTSAAGRTGPDLTHIGSRLSLGAGILNNNAGTLAGWIVASEHIKPENRMPSFSAFTGAELTALAGYLENLK